MEVIISITTNILSFFASRYSNKFLDQLTKKSLSKRLFSEIKKWAKQLPPRARLVPDSISINPFAPIQESDGKLVMELKQQIYNSKLPLQMTWFNALTERYENILETNPDPQNFYKLDKSEAKSFLNDLASKLHKVCLRDEKLLKTNLINRIYGAAFITHEALGKHLNEFNKSQIAKHKETTKYIPDIFVENYDVKETCRFFLHPSFFWEKVLWNIENCDFSYLNHLLKLIGINKFGINIKHEKEEEFSFSNPTNTVDSIKTTLRDKIGYLEELREAYLDNFKAIVKPDKLELASRAGYRIRGAISQNSDNLHEIQEQLDAMAKKLVLITSRAGKGKTNFLCDLVDNVIIKRKIPAIFFNAKDMEYNLEDIIGFLHKRALPIALQTPQECFDAIRSFCQKEKHCFF